MTRGKRPSSKSSKKSSSLGLCSYSTRTKSPQGRRQPHFARQPQQDSRQARLLESRSPHRSSCSKLPIPGGCQQQRIGCTRATQANGLKQMEPLSHHRPANQGRPWKASGSVPSGQNCKQTSVSQYTKRMRNETGTRQTRKPIPQKKKLKPLCIPLATSTHPRNMNHFGSSSQTCSRIRNNYPKPPARSTSYLNSFIHLFIYLSTSFPMKIIYIYDIRYVLKIVRFTHRAPPLARVPAAFPALAVPHPSAAPGASTAAPPVAEPGRLRSNARRRRGRRGATGGGPTPGNPGAHPSDVRFFF